MGNSPLFNNDRRYSIRDVSKTLGIHYYTATYKVKNIPRKDEYIVDINKGGRLQRLMISGHAINKYILGIEK